MPATKPVTSSIKNPLRVAFHLLHFTERGTSGAVYDYAEGNETILGNRSLIIHPRSHPVSHPQVELRFRRRFPCRSYSRPEEIEEILAQEEADCIYTLAAGYPEPLSAPSRLRPNLVHAVFVPAPHGQRYAVISPSISRGGQFPVVPHVVQKLATTGFDLRQALGVPSGDLVLGRHGGKDTFNAPGVEEGIFRHLEKEDAALTNKRTWFLFMNTSPLSRTHPRILYREATGEREAVGDFVAACDAMLHARADGETFGLAVAEFALAGKPVLTWPAPGQANHHIEVLGEKALLWHNAKELEDLLQELPSILAAKPSDYWLAFSEFSPAEVMKKFEQTFLSGLC